ncbi:efflux RND transporter periplasmic adaptor subunit [Immundisolibacter sp.]|uniref:efflux RND transporter periplasmic adaptor subunit n=1 Tax=Immundisolibacter sp. TaxID=1934948 RepID=UPI0035690747
MNKRTRWGLLAVLAVVAIVTVVGYRYRASGIADHAATPVARVERSDLEEIITAQGKLEPKEFVDVGAQVSGQLSRLHVEIGDAVSRGQLIAEIDPRIYAARVEADRARLASLAAQLAEQEAQSIYAGQVLARNRKLIEARAVSQEAVEESESALRVAQARAASLRAQIDEARSTLAGDEANLSYTRIYAPLSGTVVTKTAREGQTLNANQIAPVILQIADLGTMTVRAQVAEADVPRIRPGMRVSFSTLGAIERRWEAVVRQILPSPELINDVVLYNVLADVENRDGQLMNGMSTQMFFHVSRAEKALVIPTTALGRRRPGQDTAQGQAYEVRRRKTDQVAIIVVHVGLVTRAQAEIRAGLALGDEVLLPPPKAKPTRPRWGI